MSEFKKALEDVFEERADELGAGALALLEAIFERGVLEGRQLERQDQLEQFPLEKAVRSECGNYLCVPVPRHMLVLEGAAAGMDRLEREIRTRQRSTATSSSPMSEMLAAMDGEILEKLASQARELEGLQHELALVIPARAPRVVPARQRANASDWVSLEDVVGTAMPDPEAWKRELFGTYATSQTSSMADALRRSVTVTPLDGSSGKR